MLLKKRNFIETGLYRRLIKKHVKNYAQLLNTVIPEKCHKAVGKETGETNHIERFNNTMRQRISRLVRSTLSFSKNINNHIGAVWNFVHHYNADIAPKLAATTC